MKKISILFCFVFVTMAFGQTDFKQIVPPNPNVASLFKSVVTPVSEYSGLPNVSVPLHTVSQGNIAVPLSISYHTGGIMVGEESGPVGLGWALSAGGAITRSVNGIDDFKATYGYYMHSKVHPDLPTQTEEGLQFGYWRPDIMAFVESENAKNNETQAESCYFIQNDGSQYYDLLSENPTIRPDYDYMPDTFHFSFNGYSGSFVFDANREIFLLHKKGLKVKMIGGIEDGFRITTEDGTRYEFTDISRTYLLGLNPDDHISAWYLTSITDIYGNEVIFHYDTSSRLRAIPTFVNSFIADIKSGVQSYSYQKDKGPITETTDVFLDSVVVRNATRAKTQSVVLDYSSLQVTNNPERRRDLNSRYLKGLEVYNMANERTDYFNLYYSYFGRQDVPLRSLSFANGDFAQEVGAVTSDYPHLNLRLRLDQVVKNGIEKHSFEYFGCDQVPNKTNAGQDYWGFYNGAINSNTFIPYAYDYDANAQNSIFTQEEKANRLPSIEFAKTFSLKSITYPTKGKTEFDYELNTYDPDSNPGEFPIVTVPKSKRASKVATIDPLDDEVVETITPKIGSVLKLSYNVTFTGWNTAYNNGQYANLKPPPPNWQNDFYVEFRDRNGNRIGSRFHIPIGNSEWDALTPEINQGYSQERIINYSDTQEWYFDDNAVNQLTDEEYRIVAYFDSSDGLYYGQADIHAQWDEALVDESNQYSVGGGLRVASIVDYDSDGMVATKKNYNYHYQDTLVDGSVVEKSYGKIKTMPNFTVDKIAVFNISVHYNDYPPDYAPIPVANATSQNSFSKDQGSYVGYDRVEVTTEGSDGPNGKTVKEFHNHVDVFRTLVPEIVDQGRPEDSFHQFPPIRLPQNGLPKNETHYKIENEVYTPVSYTEYKHTVNGFDADFFDLDEMYQNSDRVISAIKELPIIFVAGSNALNYEEDFWYCENMYFHFYPRYANLVQLKSTTETVYGNDSNIAHTTVQEFEYENDIHYQRTLSKLTDSRGREVVTRTFYPDDIAQATTLDAPNLTSQELDIINRLKSDDLHRINEAIQTETTVNGQKTIQRTYYQDWDGDESVLSDSIWPGSVRTLKGAFDATDNPMENRLNYHTYDAYGNPTEVSKEHGATIAYLWGYRHQYPVAKIENATYDQVLATGVDLTVINDVTKTDAEIRAELQKVRDGLPNAMVTSYTYTPLIGVTSVTDARGYTMYYSYDAHNRLKEVRDGDNHLISDYEYHYKGQN